MLDYLDYYDNELTDKADIFIEAAEKEVARVLRVPFNEKLVQLRFTTDERDSVAIPQDYIESKEMFIKETNEIIKMSEFSFIMRKRAGIDKSTEGSGRYYARIGNTFIMYPALEDDETVIFNYYADPSNMRNPDDTSYLLVVAPMLLLYLSLKHAMIFLKNDEDAGKYSALANGELEQVRLQVNRMDNMPSQKVVPARFL